MVDRARNDDRRHRGLTRATYAGLWLILVALCLNLVRVLYGRYEGQFSQTSVASVIPYTIVLRVVRHEPNKEPVTTHEETLAVRSDGSAAKQSQAVLASGPFVFREIYLTDGRLIMTNDVAERWNLGKSRPVAQRLRDPNTSCLDHFDGTRRAGERIVGESTVAGYRVINIHTSLSVTSFAPAVGCGVLYARGHGGFMDRQLTKLTLGEPDEALFDVPARYTRVDAEKLFDAGMSPGN